MAAIISQSCGRMRCPMARREPQRAADRMVAAVVQGPSPASAKGPPVKFLAPNRTVTPQTQKGLQDLRARPLSWRGRNSTDLALNDVQSYRSRARLAPR